MSSTSKRLTTLRPSRSLVWLQRTLRWASVASAILLALSLGNNDAFAQDADRRVFRAYTIADGSLDDAAQQLKAALEEAHVAGEVVVDQNRQRVLVGGTQAAHDLARQTFAAEATTEVIPLSERRPSQVKITDAPKAARVASSETSTQLKHVGWRQLLSALQGMTPNRLALTQAEEGTDLIATLPSEHGQTTMRVNPETGSVQLQGAPELAQAWLNAIQTIDQPTPVEATRMMPMGVVSVESVSRAIELLRTAQQRAATKNVRWGADVVGLDGATPRPSQPSPVVIAQADGRAAPTAEETPDDDANPAESATAGDEQVEATVPSAAAGDAIGLDGSLLSSVQIEFVEGLDAIIIRGRKRDVDRVMKLIGQIEQMSAETEPKIELVPLKHVNSQSMAELVQQLNTQALAVRNGNVSITPLVKPNALLLIGRPEGVASTMELIDRLDQPVEPASQFRIFHLQHAPANDATRTITTFFTTRGGLGPRVLVQADFRTNSLIVYASPRDMVEVEHLVSQIDVSDNKATSEVRVFKLRNALAEELAPVLESTLRGDAPQGGAANAGQQQGGGQGGAPPGGQAQGAGATSTGQSTRASILTMVHIDAEGKKLLRSGILTEVRVAADVRANSLLITAPAESMGLIEALVKQLDELPTSEAKIKVFTIENGDSSALTEMLEELFGRTQQGNQNGPGLQTAAGAGESSLVPLRFSNDVRTNSIIATGSTADLVVVEAILLRLDENDASQRKMQVFRLQNAPAEYVAEALNEMLQTQRQLQQNVTTTILSPFEQIEREVIVVPELVSNSLIISASPRYTEEIQRIVRELDERPPMVLIQVLIAEVNLSSLEELGAELGIQDSLLFDRSVAANNTLTPGFNFNNTQALGNSSAANSLATRDNAAGQALSNLSVGRSNGDLGYGGLVLSASSESINVLIRALQDSKRLDILSRPQVMTLNNQEALVLVGARVPRITSTNQTQFGVVNSTELEPVGLQLLVRPRISPDGLVVMAINAEKSELGATADGIPISINQNGDVIRSPIINTTRAQTTISARHGQTVILGGLITKNHTVISRKVPYLADIPLLGNLFRFDSASDERTELLFIMTPYIVRKPEDAEALTVVESERMSWCLADVLDVHGNIEAFSGNASEPLVVRPDADPMAAEVIVPGEPTYETNPPREGSFQFEEPRIVPPRVDGEPTLAPEAGVSPSDRPIAPEPSAAKARRAVRRAVQAESGEEADVEPVTYVKRTKKVAATRGDRKYR